MQDGTSFSAAQAIGTDRPIYFFHLPKTGGRTIERNLTHAFGAANLFRPRKDKRALTDIARTTKHLPSKEGEVQLGKTHIGGHFAAFSLIQGYENRYHKACFWRDPADWMLSLYNWRLYRNRARLQRAFAFPDQVRSLLPNPMTELFLLYCYGMTGIRYCTLSEWEKFQAVVELAQKFDIFADIRQVDDYIEGIGLNGNRVPDANRIRSSDKPLETLDPTTRAWIAKRSPVDALVHRIARGEDLEEVTREAAAVLRKRVGLRELGAVLALPYYRAKVWVLPFVRLTWSSPYRAGSERAA